MLSALRRLGAQLGARFDLAALRPPDVAFAAQAVAAQGRPALRTLRAWCLAGSSPLKTRLAVAVLEGGNAASAHTVAQALCLERDGSLQLLACEGAAGRLALRLKTKLHDVTPWRERQPGDAWDAGFLPGTAAGLQALARFEPRRATLLVAQGLSTPALRATCALLHARQRHYHHAVRLLLLPAAPGLDVGRPVKRIRLERPARPR
jgi:hypothetical protein